MSPAPRTSPIGPDVLNSGSWDDVPEQLGSRKETPQPGPYRFKLPTLAALQKAIVDVDATVNEQPVKRMAVKFRDGAELLIIQSPKGELDGHPYQTYISNVERPRGKKDDPNRKMASDLDYLLQKVGTVKRPRTNQEYKDALLAAAGKEFGADISWGMNCSKTKAIRVYEDPDDVSNLKTVAMDGEEGRQKVLGCGTRFYQKDLLPEVDADGKPTGRISRTMDCTCGAVLFANDNLENFRA